MVNKKSDQLSALIIGLGSIGRRHGRNFAKQGVKILGYDPTPQRCTDFVDEIPGVKATGNLDEALKSACDFAVIASPNKYHVEQSLACARHNMHLLIEKPVAIGNEGLDDLENEISKRKLIAHVGSNWKFHPSVALMHDYVKNGHIGQVRAVQALGGQYLPDWHPWEDYRQMYSSQKELGGGVLHDCHDLDYLSWVLGPLESVSCVMINTGSLEISTPDLACMGLKFKNGCLGTLQIDYLQRPHNRRVHITGTTGTLIWDFGKNHIKHYTAIEEKWHIHRLDEDYDINQMYVDQAVHFIRAMENDTPTMTPISAARHVVNIFEGCKESSAAEGEYRKVKHG